MYEDSNLQPHEGPMTAVAEIGAPVSPALVAALLLAGTEHLRTLHLPGPTAGQVIEATGASRSRAYELRDSLRWKVQRRADSETLHQYTYSLRAYR